MKFNDEVNPDGKELVTVEISMADTLLELAGDFCLNYEEIMFRRYKAERECCAFHKEMDEFIVYLLAVVGSFSPSALASEELAKKFKAVVAPDFPEATGYGIGI